MLFYLCGPIPKASYVDRFGVGLAFHLSSALTGGILGGIGIYLSASLKEYIQKSDPKP